MNNKQKRNLMRIILVAMMMAGFYFIKVEGALRFYLYMIPYFVIGYDILWKAVKGIRNKQPFDENLLMAVATLGAIALGVYGDGDYTEAIAVMLFYQIGEWFQSYAVGKSRRNISDLMDIRPDYANVEDENGQLVKVDPDEVEVGTEIVVRAGEKVPIDGVVVEGRSTLHTGALTGESIPRDVEEGDDIVSGCINLSGLLKIRTTKEFGDSTVSKILELVESAGTRKSKAENFITRFAKVYTPIVVAAAVALAIIPPIINSGFLDADANWSTWIYRALTFLVISCPCALVISIPLTFFAGIGGAGREGILIKGSSYMEILSQVKTVVFDKTGTLTKGVFEVTAAHPETIKPKDLLHLTAHVERYSTHPIAASLRAAYPNESDRCHVTKAEEIVGQGIRADVNGDVVCVGNTKMMKAIGVEWKDCDRAGSIIHVAINGIYVGHIVISDVIKDTSKEAIQALKNIGVKKTVMLTGDADNVAQDVGKALNLDKVYSRLLPGDKVGQVECLLRENKGKGKLAFVGDGINDAPVLTRADIGIAMGAMGADAAIEAADVVLMDDNPLKISGAIKLSRKCIGIVKENIWLSIGVKVICLLLGAAGIANMWFAIFADVGVMVIAVLNAIRVLFTGKKIEIIEKTA